MDEFARRNLRDFLMMYNQFTEICFNHCIQNFNYRDVIQEEEACTSRCAEKLINVNHRLITTYMEVNPLNKQKAALEAAAAQNESQQQPEGGSGPPEQPLNLAGQVQDVFGPGTVVTADSVGAVTPEVHVSRAADLQPVGEGVEMGATSATEEAVKLS